MKARLENWLFRNDDEILYLGAEFSFFDDPFLAKHAEISQICRYKFLSNIGVFHHFYVVEQNLCGIITYDTDI